MTKPKQQAKIDPAFDKRVQEAITMLYGVAIDYRADEIKISNTLLDVFCAGVEVPGTQALIAELNKKDSDWRNNQELVKDVMDSIRCTFVSRMRDCIASVQESGNMEHLPNMTFMPQGKGDSQKWYVRVPAENYKKPDELSIVEVTLDRLLKDYVSGTFNYIGSSAMFNAIFSHMQPYGNEPEPEPPKEQDVEEAVEEEKAIELPDKSEKAGE